MEILDATAKNDHGLARRFFSSLRKYGPLAAFKTINEVIQHRFLKKPNSFFLCIDKFFFIIQQYLDRQFDRKYGTDTSGVIDLKELTLMTKNNESRIYYEYYEPMTEKIFRQIMNQLNINFGSFNFIDFGSGKGRVLLLACEYGFKKIIGVEFAKELHLTATRNAEIFFSRTKKPNNIEIICMDATEFNIPTVPLVIFFYCPFFGKVLEKVLSNITSSMSMNPREIIIIDYGGRDESISMFKETKFHWRELPLSPDWSRFKFYRCLMLTSSGLTTGG